MRAMANMMAWIGAAVVALAVAGCGKSGGEKHFGEPFTDAPLVTVAQLLETPDAFTRKAVRVKGTIERQCPSAGCWFVINDGQGRSIKAELGDYLPKLPIRIGDTAEVEGELIKRGESHGFIGTRVTFAKKGSA